MSSAALTIDQDVWQPKYNPWLIAVVVALAAFMEVLDTSIANVALPYMAGNLGASQPLIGRTMAFETRYEVRTQVLWSLLAPKLPAM